METEPKNNTQTPPTTDQQQQPPVVVVTPDATVTTGKPSVWEREVRYVPFGHSEEIAITAAMVRRFIAAPSKAGHLPNDRDCVRFVMLCKGKAANPFEGDVFLLGYDNYKGGQYENTSWTMVCGIELFLKRAEASDEYDGNEAGIILQTKDGQIVERQGALILPGEMLVGGWAKVHRKNHKVPDYKAVSFNVYNSGYSRWKADPAGQIAKVALSQALRQAFPTALGGMYTQDEMQRVSEVGDDTAVTTQPALKEAPRGAGTPLVTFGTGAPKAVAAPAEEKKIQPEKPPVEVVTKAVAKPKVEAEDKTGADVAKPAAPAAPAPEAKVEPEKPVAPAVETTDAQWQEKIAVAIQQSHADDLLAVKSSSGVEEMSVAGVMKFDVATRQEVISELNRLSTKRTSASPKPAAKPKKFTI